MLTRRKRTPSLEISVSFHEKGDSGNKGEVRTLHEGRNIRRVETTVAGPRDSDLSRAEGLTNREGNDIGVVGRDL